MKPQRKKYLPPEMYESWGGLFMPKRYEVLNKQTWVTCKTAKLVNNTQLHYMLYDGKQGVAEKGRWRVKGENVAVGNGTKTNFLIQAQTDAELQLTKQDPYKPDFDTRDREGYDPDDNILEI